MSCDSELSCVSKETTPLTRVYNDDTSSNDEFASTTNPPISEWFEHIQKFIWTNSFVIKAALAIGIASLYPPLGAIYVHPEITATWIAVMFIFTMAGLCLKSSEFVKAATSLLWFNTFVLVYNFGCVSLIVFAMTKLVRLFDILPEGLTNGMVICSCMPVTVTMVIVLTKSAHGNEVASVMLAATGSLLSVFVTPMLLLLYIGVQSDVSFSQVFFKLVVRVVVPLLFGQILQWYSPTIVNFVSDHKKQIKKVQENTLIFIIYTVFCKTFLNPIQASFWDIACMAFLQGTTLILVMAVAWYALKCFFRNDPRLRVTGLYGCTQKSVAIGIPMISALYEHDPHAGLFTLPLLIWHPIQLLIGCAVAPYLAAGVERVEGYEAAIGKQHSSSHRPSFFASSVRESMRRASAVAFETEEIDEES